MNKEKKNLLEFLKNDEVLSKNFDALLLASETPEKTLDAVVAFAAEQGITLNKEDIRFVKTDRNEELSDAEMDSVVGGWHLFRMNSHKGHWEEKEIRTETDYYKYAEWVE